MKSHHLPNGCFRNRADLKQVHTSLWNVIKWKWNSPKVKRVALPLADQEAARTQRNDAASRNITWIGHASFLIQYQGLSILTDPHFSDRASPFQFAGPKRTTPPALRVDELPEIHVVVISHDHYDHLDRASVLALNKRQASKPPLFVVPLRLGEWLTRQGIHNWVELDWWESTEYEGWTFSAVPVQHFSGRGLKPNNTLWAGWVMQSPEGYSVFFAGDTGYSDDFAEIGGRFGPIDLSLIPIGAYEPRWFMKDVHANPEDAVRMHVDVGSRHSIGMHWGSFVLTDEPMDEPPKGLIKARQKWGVAAEDFTVMGHGECRPLPEFALDEEAIALP